MGYIDKIGTNFEDDYITTGMGSQFALPLIRERWRPDMTESEARSLLEDGARILWYRDCRSLNRFTIAKVRFRLV